MEKRIAVLRIDAAWSGVALIRRDRLHVPFLYSTNGEVLWSHDIRHDLNRSRRIKDFHTPAALEEMLHRDFEATCTRLAELPNNHDRLRPYQADANAAVEKAIAERKRQMLVAMATGTGKTFTTVNQVFRLMKSCLAQRISPIGRALRFVVGSSKRHL